MTIKKSLAVVLTVCIIFSVMNIGVFAASSHSISVGEVVTASATSGFGKLALEFVPEESGTYAFYSMGDCDTCGYIFDSDMNLLCENDDYIDLNFYAVYNMTAGEKYILRSELYSNDGEGEYTVSVEKVEAAEELIIFHGGETFGYEGGYLSLECIAEPEGSFPGFCYWESDNEDVAVIDYSDETFCEIYLVSVGTANITVTNADGLSDTVEIQCIRMPEIVENEAEYVSFGVNGGTRCYTFTPNSDGMYVVYTSGALIPNVNIYDSNWEYLAMCDFSGESTDVSTKLELIAGETYIIEVSSYFESPDFELYVAPCTPAEGMQIICSEEPEGYRGMTLQLDIAFSPEAAIDEDCTWTSSNSEVATVVYNEAGYAEIALLSKGTAIITATSENGLSDSITVTCHETDTITLNEEKNVEAGNLRAFSFIPEKSGTYAVVFQGEISAYGLIFDSTWMPLGYKSSSEDSSSFCRQADLEQGEEYFLLAIDEGTLSDGSYTVVIKECNVADSVEFSCGGSLFGYTGELVELSVLFGTADVKIEDCEFYSSNEDVATIDYYYGNNCQLYLSGEGSTTLTVKTESGLKANCIVSVSALEFAPLALNEEVTVTVDKYANSYFAFTPEEDGVYSFISKGDLDTYAGIVDEELYEYDFDDDRGDGVNFCLQLEMTAGETYLFKTSSYDAQKGDSYIVKMINASEAQALSFDCESVIYAAPNTTMQFTAEFTPEGALSEEVYFRVSDRNVLDFYMDDGESCILMLLEEGVATLEAFTDSGLYACVTIVVGDAVEKGDVNGDGQINAVDTNTLKRYVGGGYSEINIVNSDMNDDGIVDSRDSNLLRRVVAGQ